MDNCIVTTTVKNGVATVSATCPFCGDNLAVTGSRDESVSETFSRFWNREASLHGGPNTMKDCTRRRK